MPGNRKAAENYIIEIVEKILPGGGNGDYYKQVFASMSDKDFEKFINSLESGENTISIIAPNLSKAKLSVERNLQVAKEVGHKFFEKIWIDSGDGVPPYLSPIEYLVVDLPLRRQAQLLVKKISIPENNNVTDNLTGQPTGVSKGSRMSYPETQIMAALGLSDCLTEMLKYRGGDVRGFDAMNASIAKTGGVSLTELSKLGTKVKSTQTLHNLLLGMHLSNTL